MIKNRRETAAGLSQQCFLNSLFREWQGYRVKTQAEELCIEIDLAMDETLLIPLSHFSKVGRHRYEGPAFIAKGTLRKRIEFSELVQKLSLKVRREFGGSTEAYETFLRRVFLSAEMMSEALNEYTFQPSRSFIESEQALMIGHNFHPHPKSKDEFDSESLRRYAPEFGAKFPIVWLLVHPSILHQKTSMIFGKTPWTHELLAQEEMLREKAQEKLQQGYAPYPMHPWQWERLRERPLIRNYLATGEIQVLGDSSLKWAATSSLRSLYEPTAAYMIKFSMTLRLTNSIRHMLPREVERGLQLHNVLESEKGKAFQEAHPQFRVLNEPAFYAIQDEAGEPLAETILLGRYNPFKNQRQEIHLLATLCQPSLHQESSDLRQALEQIPGSPPRPSGALHWLDLFFKVAIRPLIEAYSQYGIILGAHQQNLLLELEEGLPIRAYFRDCQGTGYSELGVKNFAHDVESLRFNNGNLVSQKMGLALFTYYVVINSSYNVIAALSEASGLAESKLIERFRSHLCTMSEEPQKDPSVLRYILHSPYYSHKGNFICSITNQNENTTDDPLAIYNQIENVFYRPEKSCEAVL